MKQNMFKKSQMEMFGISLVIIIVLVFLGFMLRNIVTEKHESPQKEYITSQYANDVIDVTIRTNAKGCKGLPIKDLVQDCEASADSATGGSGEKCNPADNSPTAIRTCPYAKQEITKILKWFLQDEVGVDYYFVVFTGNINENEGEVVKWPDPQDPSLNVFFKIGSIGTPDNPSQCPSDRRSKTYQLPSTSGSGGSIFIKLDICI